MTAINFPAGPSNGDTHQGFVYNATLGVWQSAGTQTAVTSFAGLSDTPSTLGTAGQIAKVNSGATALEFADQSGVTVYANVDALPGSGNTGDLAFVTATNRLYIWNGSGWYNIALINTTPSISGVNSSYNLAIDGTATVITITAVDAEGLPITYSIASDTSGNAATVVQGTGANTNVFTITPSTNTANGGTFSLTFRASDGVNIATAVSEFTLQFSVENQRYTTALITSVGANLADNNDFVDSSTNSHTITAAGNATQTTFSPYRHGGYSMRTTAGTSLNIPASTDNQFTGDFTIEAWVYSLDIGDRSLYVHGSYFAFNVNFGGGFNIYLNSGGATFSPTDIVPAANEWNHVALVRSGSTVSVYLNGVASATTATNSATVGYNSIAYIGGLGTQAGGSMNGYIADFRAVNGSAVYTSNFTPPTERLTEITNTSLLACHLPYIADGSTNNKNLTSSGTISTEPFAPYDAQEYTAAAHGGSMYFDGSGDYVTVPNHTSLDLASNDFTIEFWAYSSNPNTAWPLGKGDASSAAGSSISWYWGAGYSDFYSGSSGVTLSHGAIFPANQWFHVACCRSGNDFTFYLNGVSVATTSTSGAINTTTNDMWVGAYPAAGTWPGTIADFRFVKGTAVYTSAFTPPTAPLTAISGTSLLLKGTDAGIIDKAQSVKTITLNGDVKSSTTQSKFLTSSMYFDGTGDYIAFTSDLYGWTGDFTIEAWVYHTSFGAYSNAIYTTGANSSLGADFFELGANSGGRYQVFWGSGSPIILAPAADAVPVNTWSHVALTRSGSTLRLYLNGTLSASTTKSGALPSSTTDRSFIGTQAYGPGASTRSFYGYMSDVRLTKGLARYTANFTPPAAALKG